VGFVHAFEIRIPSSTIQEKAVDVAAIFRRFADIILFAVFGDHIEIESQRIDGEFILNKNINTFLA